MWWRPVFKRGVLGALLVVGQLCVAYPTWSLPMNGKDGFHSVPNGLKKEWDGVESVLTRVFRGLTQQAPAVATNLLTSSPTRFMISGQEEPNRALRSLRGLSVEKHFCRLAGAWMRVQRLPERRFLPRRLQPPILDHAHA